jgi:hypothetical protein
MEWPSPYSAIEHRAEGLALEAELLREVKPEHPLFGIPLDAIARDQDDVLFAFRDGTGRFAEVHLTWAGARERPPWPGTTLFDSLSAWAKSVRDKYREQLP